MELKNKNIPLPAVKCYLIFPHTGNFSSLLKLIKLVEKKYKKQLFSKLSSSSDFQIFPNIFLGIRVEVARF